MSMFWKDMTTRGAVVGGFLGLITAFFGVVLSPAVWEGIFGNPKGSALVTIDNPTLFSMTLAFVAIYVVSKVDSSKRASTRSRRLHRAVRAVSDGHRRRRRGRALTGETLKGAIRASGFGRAPFLPPARRTSGRELRPEREEPLPRGTALPLSRPREFARALGVCL